jgi:hypothetical protein
MKHFEVHWEGCGVVVSRYGCLLGRVVRIRCERYSAVRRSALYVVLLCMYCTVLFVAVVF